ncbi:conditioned medium-induced protein 4 [Haloferacaceae archaeon DSL9]
MDEKTAELRDIFIDATGSDTVTESQEESPGSLTEQNEDSAKRVPEIIATMRERYTFASGLTDEQLESVVRAYHDDREDDQIAADLGIDSETVFNARMDLHLIRESDRNAPFSLKELRSLVVEDASISDRADALDTDEDTVGHFSEIVEADIESTRANDRFCDEFRDILTDSDLEGQLAQDAREDGLREATEDIETDVSF